MSSDLSHRGGCGCEEATGDGAGMLSSIPREFLQACAERGDIATSAGEQTLQLPDDYILGQLYLPLEEADAAPMRAACEAVRLASMICVETQRTLTSAEKVSKSDDSPVTVADFAAQALVTSVLEKSHPDIEMVAEESADDLRGDENAPLLDRVTSLVNKVLLMSTDEENGDAEADKVVRLMFNEEVADAIDIGGKTDPTRTGKCWIQIGRAHV